ncbi:MAG: tRNA lysidine(34) synthetase TilS [Gammaproteobacteria bacterium]|mgnify:FL=1|jgi:tRNA(Ile)-lysidine synthase|nr:tRNA lysidine(34) synthetase TilS [Gammaproteobacteria bacterium]MBT3724630.1 tRNA lysidine(34) synthetase TilS [Gammaproteobacteria bacterium]MBT4075983.1 tRNA lysidine(34) synthetase TilS [Gammaproteobacteria bacterium]MBT4194143.1 tRNA lysidine(34) synthetase TilS [Gammaproteobacteria bacterium]MBT4451754.1 tRNA lysidine(34) synthetase TilS [Gammaproteobacteria bacterium]
MCFLQLSLDSLPKETKKLYLAFSGGIDSTVLLHALQPHQQHYQIIVWHINHGLQGSANSMQEFARQQANQYGLEFRLDNLNMDPLAGNLEAKARDHRYRLFENVLCDHDVLLTAHHKNDQAETLILNMMRGSGSSGLRAIARQKSLGKGVLFRPLLNYSRHEIEQYAESHKLEWIEDPSNKSIKFDRNYLRHEVLPAIIKRWPSAISQLQRVSELQNESEQLQTDLARIDYLQAEVNKPFSPASCISIEALSLLSLARKKNMIRYWIKVNDFSVIGFHKIEELLKQLNSRIDAMPVIVGNDFQVRVFKKMLYLVDGSNSLDLEVSYNMPDSGYLDIPGLNFSQSRSDVFEYLKKRDEGQSIELKFRQPTQSGITTPHSHSLKRLFQKNQIPPWKRSSIPQIFLNNELSALWLL